MYIPLQHKDEKLRDKKRGIMAIHATEAHWFVLLRDCEGGVGTTVHAVPKGDYYEVIHEERLRKGQKEEANEFI